MQITNTQVQHINQQLEAFQTDVEHRLESLRYQVNQLAGGNAVNTSTPRGGAATGRQRTGAKGTGQPAMPQGSTRQQRGPRRTNR